MSKNLCRSLVSYLIGIAVILGFALTAMRPDLASAQQSTKKLTIFIEPDVHYDSVWMADAKGFYKAEGLDVAFKQFPTGMNALAAFRAGEGDIVLSGELPALLYWVSVDSDYRLLTVLERDSAGFVVVAQ